MIASRYLRRRVVALLAATVSLLPQALLAQYPPNSTFTAVPAPATPRPAYNVDVTDPSFGTIVTRITDQGAPFNSNQFVRHHYSKDQPWNSDGTLLKLKRKEHPLLDGNTYAAIPNTAGKAYLATSDTIWANTAARTLYGIEGTTKLVRIDVTDPTAPTRVTLRDFTGTYTKIHIGPNEGNLTDNDRYVLLACESGANLVLNLIDLQTAGYPTVATTMLAGMYTHLDWATVSPSGQYVVINWDRNTTTAQPGYGIDCYTVNLANGTIAYRSHLANRSEHGDIGYDSTGQEVYVQINFETSDASIVSYRLSDGTRAIQLRRSPEPVIRAAHVSCRNLNRPGWAYVTGEASETATNEAVFYIFALKLDGSNTVQKFAHTHATNTLGYEFEPTAVPDRSGTRVMWSSEWNGTSSSPVFTYVAESGVSNVVSAPTFSPPGGTYSSTQSVSLASATSGASIRYTTNGTTPTATTGTVYSGPVSIAASSTLKAIAYKSGMTDSAVSSATYTITTSPAQVGAPTFSPGGGTYTTAQSVTISSATSGATIRYTTNGTTPSATTGTVYSGPVSIAATSTLKAIAYSSGMTDSAVTSATYTINTGGGGGTLYYAIDGNSTSFLEAETYTAKAGSFAAVADSAVSGGTYMHTPNGSGTNTTSNYIKYEIDVTNGGTFYVHLLGYGLDGSSDSFNVAIDTGNNQVVDIASTNTWVWKRNSGISIPNGTHTLWIKVREDGARVDKIALTKSSTAPSGQGGAALTPLYR
jgi:hypothetical protein